MLNKLCKWVSAVIVAGGLVLPDRAVALGGSFPSGFAYLGSCNVELIRSTFPPDSARVYIQRVTGSLFNPVFEQWSVDGKWFNSFGLADTYGDGATVTAATVATCFNTTPDLVTDFSSDGPDGTFATDDYVGFSFTYQNYRYEYAFSGLADTQLILSETSLAPPTDADADLASGSAGEAASIGSTVETSGAAVSLLDFTLSDGGGGDAVPLVVTALDVNVLGTGAASAAQLTWLLNGPDATNVQGTVGGGKITFSGLSVSVDDTASETYVVSAYFNDSTGLTEEQTLSLSIDGDTDVTVASGSTTFGTTTPVTNGSGAAIDVVATRLAFTTQPAGSVSGAALNTQPIVTAQDAAGNTDIDFAGTVTLTEASEGALSGTASVAAVSGVATFSGIIYRATADQQDFGLTAASGALTSATSNTVTSDVVATKLVFATQPAPLSFNGNATMFFTTVPLVHAVDDDGVLDSDYVGQALLSEVNGLGAANFSNETESFAQGVATFTGLGLMYLNNGVTTETFNIVASSGALASAQSAQLTARLAPAVVEVSSSTVDGSYKAGGTVSIQVTFSEAVVVTGTPELLLETGTTDRAATYASGTSGTVLTFNYTVQAGDTAADLDYTATTALSGTIKSAANATDAVLTLPIQGQSGSLGATKALVIDTTAPSGYTVALDQGLINDGNKTAASLTFASAEVGTSYSYTLSSSGGGSPVTGNGTIATATDQITSLDVSGLSDGTLTLSVTLTDNAGNSGSAATDTVSKDATAPSGQSVTFAQSVVNDSNKSGIGFTFAGAEVGTSYSYTISSSGGGTNVTGSGSIATATDQIAGLDLSGLADGTLTLSVTLTDGASNVATDVTTTVTKDVSAPSSPWALTLLASSNSGSLADTLTNDTTPTITGSAEEDSTVEVFIGGTSAGTTPADGSGNWSFTFADGALSSGEKSITATARDAAGNVSSTYLPLVFTIDPDAPSVAITGPTDVVTEAFTTSFIFSETVNDFIVDDITVVNGTKGAFSGSGTTYALVITPELGSTVSVSVAANMAVDDAGNSNEASNTLQVSAGSPASEFSANEDEIRHTVVDAATRSLQSTIATNRRMIRDARERFIAEQSSDDSSIAQSDVPFDVSGSFDVNGVTISSKGTYFGAQSLNNGTRHLMFGDFDVQNDGETGSNTATLTGRVAWEQYVSEKTMLGYFIGGELAQSDISGDFNGEQNRVGVTVGGYAVHEFADQVLLDGFFSLGAGRNNLEITDTVLALESDYITRSAIVGAALSGVIEQDGFELWPELSLNFGRTWIGNVDFTGRAYSLVDDKLSLDAGQVTMSNMMLRPEVRVPLDGLSGANSLRLVTFAPRLMCEQIKAATTEDNCGGGAEVGFSGRSADGLSSVSAKVLADRIGDSTKSSLQLNLEHRF